RRERRAGSGGRSDPLRHVRRRRPRRPRGRSRAVVPRGAAIRRAVFVLIAAGCAPDGAPPEECSATWAGYAEPVLRTWCTPCHSSTVVGEDRQGAPED